MKSRRLKISRFLFSDLSGFTKMSEEQGAETVALPHRDEFHTAIDKFMAMPSCVVVGLRFRRAGGMAEIKKGHHALASI